MQDKVAIVTGGAMGYKNGGPSIGGAIAIKLASDGFKVVVVDSVGTGELTVSEIKKNKGEAIFIRADVTDSSQVREIVEKTRQTFRSLNCLVNCVAKYGSGMAKSVADISEEEWTKTLNVNLGGYFLMCKHSIPFMTESGGGTIVNISSLGSFTALPNFSVYSVSKAAIDALTRSLAVDFAPIIRSNSIAPGFVRIANSENNRSPDELKTWYENISEQYPMKRVCDAEEIANVASFLASDKSSYINGQTIIVDGGKSIADIHQF
jgi:NAD(P)-dependent dehydrogenase (short-subunit alcohol dehydrogenase family)